MSIAEKANDSFAEKEIQLWVDNCELLMTAWQKYSKIVEAKLEARLKIIDEKEAEIKKLEGQIKEASTLLEKGLTEKQRERLTEFLVKDCQNNKQIQSCNECKYEDECNQIHIKLIVKAVDKFLVEVFAEAKKSLGAVLNQKKAEKNERENKP